ncbi:MAG: RagB/SusD family nutrient uptake outer membrane protein [Ginsengibacter sp.]
MKKYIYVIIGLLVLTASCKKSELDLFPYDQIETTQAFNTPADVTLAVNGMYAGIRTSGSYYTGTWNILADATADNIITNQDGRGSFRTFAEWRYTGSNTYGLFSGGYTIIRRANAILENIDKFPAGTFHDDAKGQALACRAMVYFDMARVYAKTYLNATASDSILPYVTSTDPTITPKKELVTDFYNKVIADLNAAIPLISDLNVQSPSVKNPNIIRLTKVSTNAILSRVLLYKGDYAGTISAANAALGTSYKEVSIANFSKIWTDETDSGVLFKIRNTVLDNNNTLGVNYSQTVGGKIRAEFTVEYNFYQMFASNDIRKSAYITTGLYNGVLYNDVIKWLIRPGGVTGVVDGKVIRTAEVLLNRMEAYYRSGNQPAALADLRILKAARYSGYDPTAENLSGQALLDEILLQRRLELAFEGDRFFTLKRLNLPVNRDGTKGERADGSGTPYVFTTLAAGDYRFQLPYPALELSVNPNFGGNNPGY